MSVEFGWAELRYYGHSAFMWKTPRGARVVVDPFRNPSEERPPWFMREFPRVQADLVLVSHPHFDHDAFERVLGEPTIMRTPGEFRGKDFTVEAVLDRHAREYGRPFNNLNLVFIVQVADIRFCHLGDNRADLPVEVARQVGSVDVLMVPVDASHHLITYDEVDAVVELLDPKVVIPMHFLIPGLTDPDSTLQTADTWIEEREKARRIAGVEVRVFPEALPERGEVWFFKGYEKE